MEEQIQEFIAKSLKALQEQINYLDRKVLELKARIYYLEETNHWNVMKGNTEYRPEEELVSRSADGKLHYYHSAENCPRSVEEESDDARRDDPYDHPID